MSYRITSEARVALQPSARAFLFLQHLKQQLNGVLAALCQVERLVNGVQTAKPATPGNRERGETAVLYLYL